MNYTSACFRHRTSLACTFKRARLPLVIGLILSGQVYAGPEGGQVVGGAGTINSSGATTTINQATDHMAINWQSFDVNSDERVNFIQPDSSSIALNRILSNTASHINGRVDSTGQLIFVNPHGVIFGENSVINAGGILASGLDIDPHDFMNGDYTFSAVEGTDGFVLNSGILNAATAGHVTLLGKQINNEGLISAELGSLNFAAGREAVVTFGESSFVGVRVTEALLKEDIGLDPAIVNSGEVRAEGGKVLLTASTSRDIFSQAVNAEGVDYGRSVVVHEDGTFTLGEGADVANSGTIDVSGGSAGAVVVLGENITQSGAIRADSYQADVAGRVEIHSADTTLLTQESVVSANADKGAGGDIKLLGDRVGLVEHSQVEANGSIGGGQVLVGGDTRGENTDVRNASAVYVGAKTQISASALEDGDGGNVILWGNDTLSAYGGITATGAGEGSGGFVETSSGLVNLDLAVDVSSQQGEGGTWLIDPYNITIRDTGSTNVAEDITDDTFDSIFSPDENDPDVGNSILTVLSLQGALFGASSGSNVLIETTGNNGTQDGDITLASPLDYNNLGNASLTLRAHDDIFINQNIRDGNASTTDSLNLTLIANYENGGVTDGGNITIDSAATIETQGGHFTASGNNFTNNGIIDVDSATGGGNITINVTDNATLGKVRIGDTRTSGEPTTNPTSTLTVDATDITLNGNIDYGVDDSEANHTVNLTLNARGDIEIDGINFDNSSSGNDILNVTLNADTDAGEVGDPTDDGTITIDGGASLWLTGGGFSASGHDFTLGSASSSDLLDTEGGAVSLFVDGEVAIQDDITTSGGSFTVGDSVTNTFASRFDNYGDGTNSGSIITNGGAIAITTVVDATSNGDVILGTLNNSTTGANVLAGDITVTSGNDITLNNAYDFHDTGTGAIDGDNSNPSVVSLTLNADNAIILNGSILDTVAANTSSPGDAIGNQDTLNLTMNAGRQAGSTTGDITVNADIYIGGGTISTSGVDFVSADHVLNTSLANATQWGYTTTSGDINLAMRGAVTLGSIVTESGFGGGDLSITANNLISNASGAVLSVNGSTQLDADQNGDDSAASITLSGDHEFDGAVYIANAQDVTLNDVDSLILGDSTQGTSTINGTLTVSATGIADGGTLTVGGAASFTAGTGAINFGADHDFQSTVSVVSASQLTLNDNADGLALGDIAITGAGLANTIDSVGAITQASGNNIRVLGSGTASGSVTLIGNSVNIQNIDTSGANNQAGGAITVNALVGDLLTGSLNSSGGTAGNNNVGSDAALITLIAPGAITVGAIQAVGSNGNDDSNNDGPSYNGGTGAGISITSTSGGTISLQGVSSDGGNGHAEGSGNGDDANGGNAGSIFVSTAGQINLGGDITARGGRLWDSNNSSANGTANTITLTGDSVLTDDIEIDATLTPQFFDGTRFSPFVENALPAAIVFGGTVNGTTAGAEDLSVYGANITFSENIGASTALGDLVIGEADTDITDILGPLAVALDANGRTIRARSLTATGSSFTLSDINTSGFAGEVAGDITLAVDTALNTGSLTAIGGSATSSGLGGGAINVSGADITVGAINTSGSNAVTGNGGDAGAVAITALEDNGTPSILINGDIATEGGTGPMVGTPTVATLSLSGNNATSGSVTLNTTNFLTSSISIFGNSATTATDTLTGPSDAAFWYSSGAGAGRIDNAASSPSTTLTFSGFERLQGGTGADTFTLAHSFNRVSGGSGDDFFTVNALFVGRLFGNAGIDTFTLNAGVNDGDSDSRDVNGNGGNDIFNVVGGLTPTTLDGGTGASDAVWLTDTSGTHNWLLDTAASGTLNTNIDFVEVESLNGANGGDDTFEFGSFTGNYGGDDGGIDARGADNDSLLVTTSGTHEITLGQSLRGIVGVETIASNGANDGAGFTLQLNSDAGAADTAIIWTIDGTNDGSIDNGVDAPLKFVNFASLEGNQANDSFSVQSGGAIGAVRGVRTGGTLGATENNQLSFVTGTQDWNLTTQHTGTTSGSHATTFTQTQSIGGAGSDTLNARSQANTWVLGASDNTVAQTVALGDTATDTMTFTGMSTLNGNSANDFFAINTSGSWLLNGGLGDDTFQLGDAGEVTGAGAGIQGGSGGTDSLIGRDAINLWAIRAADASNTNTLADGSNTVYLADFKEIERLQGSDTSADTFDFAIFMDVAIDAGTSAGDIADYADVSGAVAVTVGTDAVNGIDQFIGNNDGLSPTSNSSTLTVLSNSGTSVAWEIFDLDGTGLDVDGINDGQINAAIDFSNFNHLVGGDGNDTFTFDPSANAVVGVTGSLTGGGNSGLVGDTIVGPNVDIAWTVAPLSGPESLTYQNGLDDGGLPPQSLETTTTFSGFETLTSGSGNDTFDVDQASVIVTLNAGTGMDLITLPDEDLAITLGDPIGGLTLNGFETVSATAGRNNALTVTSVANETVRWDINTANSGTVTVGSDAAVTFNFFQVLNGGNGDDVFDFGNGGSVTRAGTANGEVNGNGGSNTLIGQQVPTTWLIDGDASGSLRNSFASTPYVERFSGIQTLQGQSATVDQFELAATGSFFGHIDGVGTGNTLTVNSVTNERNEWRLLDDINADQVQRLDASNNASSSFTLANMAALTGGTGTDEFVFLGVGAYSGSIDALDNASENDVDIVDRSNVTGAISVALGADDISGVKNAERVVGSGSDSTLVGLDSGTNTWTLSINDASAQPIPGADGENDGVLSNSTNSIQFINFANLSGGNNAVDNFTLGTSGSITGTMSGGTPTSGSVVDSVTSTSNNSQWTLLSANTGSVDGNSFSGIERVVANGSGDTLIGIDQNNLWTVNSIDGGTVAEADGANPMTFAGMENLAGSRGDDAFVLLDNLTGNDGQITGTISGTESNFTDSGADELTIQSGSGVLLTWQIGESSGETTASVTGRVGQARLVESFVGGNGDDIFQINDADAVATVDGGDSADDVLRLGYVENAQWQIGGTSDTAAVSGRGSVTLLNIEIAEGSDTGQDQFNINGAASDVLALRGRGGNDTFTVATTSPVRLSLDGGDSSDIDEVIGANRSNQWVFDSAAVADANTLNWDSVAGTGIDFTDVENFTGGEGADTFEVRSAGLIATLRGAATDANDSAIDVLNVVRASGTTTWNITGQNAGNVADGFVSNFYDIESLLGSEVRDVFTFQDINASIEGLINGAGGVGSVDDQLNLQVFTNGVVVELGPEALPDSIVTGTASLPNVNAFQIESIVAAHSDTKTLENTNWLAIAHGDVIDWNLELEDASSPFNEGVVQNIVSLDDPTAIANTQTHFYHFGSLQGGTGGEQSNIVANGGNITGEYVLGTGERALVFDLVEGLVVVDVSPLIVRLTGNDNTLLRVAPGGDANGENSWLVNAENSGSFASIDEDFGFTFSHVNQLQGGAGNDTFTFANAPSEGTTGSLTDGFIDGAGGTNIVTITSATGNLAFGVNTRQNDPLLPEDIAASFPRTLTSPVYLANNRDGIIDLVSVAELTNAAPSTSTLTTTLISADAGAYTWNLGFFENNSQLIDTVNSSTLAFTGIDRIRGGGADDTFNLLQLGLVDNVFDGGAGRDTVNIENLRSALYVSLDDTQTQSADLVLSHVEVLTAADNGHTLEADHVVNTWLISNVDDGALSYTNSDGAQTLNFTNMAHLVGGDSQDTFQLTGAGDITGTIDGGGESANPDRVEVMTTSTEAFVFHLTTLNAQARAVDQGTDRIDLVDIERLDATNGQSHTLMGASDADNTWAIAALNTLTSGGDVVQFTGIDNLTGGQQQDTFNFNGAIVSGLVDGGAHELAEDSVILQNLGGTGITAVRLGNQVTADLNLTNIETLTATTPNALRLIGENNSNVWTIRGTDAGSVDGLSFTGFASLEGGSGSDTFVLGRQEGADSDDRISGIIDGGVNPTTGAATDRVDVTGMQAALTVALDPNYDADLHIVNMDVVEATSNNNTLVGGDDVTQNWDITERDGGELNNLAFTGFSHLLGRNQVDIFQFSETGDITGAVDGGGQPDGLGDIVDMSQLSVANVVIGDTTAGFVNIEEYRGNNTTSVLTAADLRNEWVITEANGGTIVDEAGNSLVFSGFDSLEGGAAVDIFTLTSGSISGEIRAGRGNDRLDIDLGDGVNGVSGNVSFFGNEDEDTVTIIGGSDATRFNETYTAAMVGDDPSTALVYTLDNEPVASNYGVTIAQVETINDRVFTSTFTLNNVANRNDVFSITNTAFDIAGFEEVAYANKDSLRILGEQQDQVLIDGRVSLNGDFSVTNAAVVGVDASAVIDANRQVVFNTTGAVGSQDNRLAIETSSLVLNAVRDNVYLNQTGDLEIAELSSPAGFVDIDASGSITSRAAFDSSQDLRLQSGGDILLDNVHSLSGMLTLIASTGDITLTNGTTQLDSVVAQNFTLNTTGNVQSEGALAVATRTTITAADTSVVALTNTNNAFNRVDVVNAGTLVLHDGSDDGVIVQGLASDSFVVTSTNGLTANAITSDDIALTSTLGRVTVQNALTAQNSVTLIGSGVDINGAIAVTASTADRAIFVEAGSGELNVRAALTANGGVPGDIELRGQAVHQHLGAPISGRDVIVVSQTDATFDADITATQLFEVDANGAVLMDNGVSATLTQAHTIDISAGTDIVTEQLVASGITLVSNQGNILQRGDISTETMTITALGGAFESDAASTLTFTDGSSDGSDLIINAQSAELNGDIESTAGSLDLGVAQSLLISGSTRVAGAALNAGENIVMTTDAEITSSTDISLAAGSDIQLAQLNAQQGTVTLTSGGSVTDNNGDLINITATSLLARSETGFGTTSATGTVETAIANLDLLNASGEVGLTNNQDVTVSALITNGNIRLVNTQGNVVMANASEGEYNREPSVTDARLAGGVINANYTGGDVKLVINNGYLTATPGAFSRRPELVGNVIEVTTSEGFGVDRQLVVYAQTELIVSGPGISPIWAFGDAPKFGITTDIDLIDPSIVGSVSELLIDVEGIEDVNPAVFTDVGNYAYDNISIRMPFDQLYNYSGQEYDDDEDEAEYEYD